jgi:hypothetical protein
MSRQTRGHGAIHIPRQELNIVDHGSSETPTQQERKYSPDYGKTRYPPPAPNHDARLPDPVLSRVSFNKPPRNDTY